MTNNIEWVADDIMVCHNLLSDVACDNLIEWLDSAIEMDIAAEEFAATENHTRLGRKDTQLHVSAEDTITSARFKFLRDGFSRVNLIRNLNEMALEPYVQKFNILSAIPMANLDAKIQKTEPTGGFHDWHYETSSLASCRVLTWSVFLNDDYEFGETEFLYRQVRIKPKKGSCILFPSDFMSTHRGNPPVGGVKYIATGWTINTNPYGWSPDGSLQTHSQI